MIKYAFRLCAAFSIAALLSIVTLFSGMLANAARADDRDGGPIFSVAHFDVIPITSGGVDFLQSAYALLFKYRDQSAGDGGLESFRVLNLIPPVINHSEVVQVWKNYEAFKDHLAQAHTVAFRFDVQGNPALGGVCCIGSPIDDRQYREVASFNTPWISDALPAGVGAAKSALFVVSYVDFLVDADPGKGQRELLRLGADTSKARGQLSYTVLQQLDRPNRYAVLEVWDSVADYNIWQAGAVVRNFLSKVTPLLGSPIDHRLNILCGETYVDGTGCVAP